MEQHDFVPLKIIRLIADVQFLKSDGTLSETHEAIVDIGAHTSTLPVSIWKDIKFSIKTDNAWLSGIND